jgi:hypothetical protein
MLPDLKEQWAALFPFPDGIGEVVAVLRNIYSILDWLAGQSEGSRALWVSFLASVVTIASVLHPRSDFRTQRKLEIMAHVSLQTIMLVLVGGPWIVFPLLNQCVIRGHFRILSMVLVSTAFVSGWGTHCDPEGKALSTTVITYLYWTPVNVRAYWWGLATFSLMTVAIGGTFM